MIGADKLLFIARELIYEEWKKRAEIQRIIHDNHRDFRFNMMHTVYSNTEDVQYFDNVEKDLLDIYAFNHDNGGDEESLMRLLSYYKFQPVKLNDLDILTLTTKTTKEALYNMSQHDPKTMSLIDLGFTVKHLVPKINKKRPKKEQASHSLFQND